MIGVSILTHEGVCVLKEFIIPSVTVDEVIEACHGFFKKMGLKILKDTTRGSRTTVLAGEGALLPLTLRTLLFPFNLGEYVKTAQRSGVHIIVSKETDGVHLRACGVALDEVSGKPEKYTKDEVMEEATGMLEAWDFENKFVNMLKAQFPELKEVQ